MSIPYDSLHNRAKLETKKCTSCGENKPLNAFKKRRKCIGGFVPRCNLCVANARSDTQRANDIKVASRAVVRARYET